MAGLWTASLFLLMVFMCDALLIEQQQTMHDDEFAATSRHAYVGVFGTNQTEQVLRPRINGQPVSQNRVGKHMHGMRFAEKAMLGKRRQVIEARRQAIKEMSQKRRLPALVARKRTAARQRNAQQIRKRSLGKTQHLTTDEDQLFEQEEASDEVTEEDNNPSKLRPATVKNKRNRVLAELDLPASHSATASTSVAGSVSTAATTPSAAPVGPTLPTALQAFSKAVADLGKFYNPEVVSTAASVPTSAAIASQAGPNVAQGGPSVAMTAGVASSGSSVDPQTAPSVATVGPVSPGFPVAPQTAPSVATVPGSLVAPQAAPSVATVGPAVPGSPVVPVSPASSGVFATPAVPGVATAYAASPLSSISPQAVPNGAIAVPASPVFPTPPQTGPSVATTVPRPPLNKVSDTVSDLMDKFQDRKKGIHESIEALTHAESWMSRVSGVLEASGLLTAAQAANSNSEKVEAELSENTKKLSKLIDSSLGYINKADSRVVKAEKQATQAMSAVAANESKAPAAVAKKAAKMVAEAAEDAASGAVPAAVSFASPTTVPLGSAPTWSRVSRPTVSTVADEMSALPGTQKRTAGRETAAASRFDVGAMRAQDAEIEDDLFTEHDIALMDSAEAEATGLDEDEDNTNSALVEQEENSAGSERLAEDDDAFSDAAVPEDLEREEGRGESADTPTEGEMKDAEFDTV